jgi:hypothetical protein
MPHANRSYITGELTKTFRFEAAEYIFRLLLIFHLLLGCRPEVRPMRF